MFRFLRYKNLYRFNNIQAVRIQSLLNPFRKCHCQKSPRFSLIEYLQSSLGFFPERSLTLSQQLKGRNPKNPDSVLTFFKSHGVSEAHIKSIINRAPSLLSHVSPDSSLTPKLQFFKEKGISESVLIDLVVSNPYLFTYSIEGHIKPVFDLLRSILGTDEFAVKLLSRSRLIFNRERLSTNLNILRNCGVRDQHLLNQFMNQPRALLAKPDRFSDVVEMVRGMGFKPQSYSFTKAVFIIIGLRTQTWDAKFKVYTSLGWSAEETLLLFRKQPSCMTLSEEKIRKGFDYLTKELGWGPSLILIHPTLLLCSLEKRIIPRHRFLQYLALKGFIKKDKMSPNSFMIGEKIFLKNFVIRYESEAPDILKIYEGLIRSRQLNIKDGEGCIQ